MITRGFRGYNQTPIYLSQWGRRVAIVEIGERIKRKNPAEIPLFANSLNRISINTESLGLDDGWSMAKLCAREL